MESPLSPDLPPNEDNINNKVSQKDLEIYKRTENTLMGLKRYGFIIDNNDNDLRYSKEFLTLTDTNTSQEEKVNAFISIPEFCYIYSQIKKMQLITMNEISSLSVITAYVYANKRNIPTNESQKRTAILGTLFVIFGLAAGLVEFEDQGKKRLRIKDYPIPESEYERILGRPLRSVFDQNKP